MIHCGDLPNKGWSHSGHIVLWHPVFSLKWYPDFPCWCQFLRTMWPPDHETPLTTWSQDPSCGLKINKGPLPSGHNFPSIGYKKGWLWRKSTGFSLKPVTCFLPIINLSMPDCLAHSLFLHTHLTLIIAKISVKLFNTYCFPKYALLKTSSVDELSRSSKATLARKCHGTCLVVCSLNWSTTAFESQWNYYIWDVCSANQWDAPELQGLQPALVHRKGPILLHDSAPLHVGTTNTSKVEQIGLRRFASSSIFTWLLAKWLPLLQAPWWLFAGKMLPQPARCKNCCPRVYHILKHRFFFFATGINKLIYHWQKCVDSNGSYFD